MAPSKEGGGLNHPANGGCTNCAQLEAEVALLRAENERLRQLLESSRPPNQPPNPVTTSTSTGYSAMGYESAFSRAEMQRYSRQMLVKEFGADAQRKMRDARVLVIGVGGLGSPVALYLAAMGVGTLALVDDDHVDRSNLHRQVIHDEETVGEKKVASAVRRIRLINPLVQCIAIAARFTTSNALELVTDYDVVIDASDNVGTRYLANDACAMAHTPLVSGSAIGMEGQVTVFKFGDESTTGCYRCLYPTPPPVAPMSCAENGVLGVVPGVIGCLQAVEAVKLVAGMGEPLVGVQCHYDAYDGQFRRIKFGNRRRSECPACGVTRSKVLGVGFNPQLQFEGVSCSIDVQNELEQHQQISVKDFARVRKEGEPWTRDRTDRNASSYVLIDTRPPQQFGMVHFREAVNLPFDKLLKQSPTDILEQLLGTSTAEFGQTWQDTRIYVICRRGVDSIVATRWLTESGFSHVQNVDGGYSAYAAQVDSTFPMY